MLGLAVKHIYGAQCGARETQVDVTSPICDKYRVTSCSKQQCSGPGGAVLGTLQQEGCAALEVISLWTDSPFILTRPE